MDKDKDNMATLADHLDFGEPDRQNSIIKVIGVGGGGGNAVNNMYNQGIHDVSFVVCNTDAQALKASPVPERLQLGSEGLGAGNRPEKARLAAEESIDDIKAMLSDGTKMDFITAGMGGGTGTGAAPVIAQVSKELGILTVGIVTIPFKFEGDKKIDQALDGVDEMAKHVDALLVINNERLRKVYPDLSLLNGFAKADDTLSVAAKSIAEIITVRGLINLDFNDVRTVLKDGGVAIMSTGFGEGEGRVRKAIEDALNSPLLNDNDVYNSQRILLSIAFSSENGTDWPPTPTYTWLMFCFMVLLSLATIFFRQVAVLSILLTTPLRIHCVASSLTSACTVMLPSRFFLPAIPRKTDDPSSMATINSAIYIPYLIILTVVSCK